MRRTSTPSPISRCALPLAMLLILALAGGCTAAWPLETRRPPAGPAPSVEKAPAPAPVMKDVDTGVRTLQGAQGAASQARGASGTAKSRPANTSLASFTTADFAGAGLCASCHMNLKDASGADVSMPDMWRSTMMANAGRDPVWQAKVSSEVKRAPALREIIEKKCTTCHMPMAETQALVENQKVAALDDGFYNPAHPLHDAAADGVSCTLCHQVTDANLGKVESFSGGYVVDTASDAPDRPLFGPYEQPVGEVMQASTGFAPQHASHMAGADHCATCHNLYTPYVDAEGNVLGEFPEQTPYTEWQNSAFGASDQSCQGCHMPQAQGSVKISIVPADVPDRQPYFQHFFVGGNAFMLRILRDWGGSLGVTADVPHFDATLERVDAQLGQQAANLALQNLDVKDGTLRAQFEITTLTGHKFPTSFPSRRAWLHVTVKDAEGRVVFESGAHQPDGSITGNDADTDPAAFEPHYDVITAADQVQIYEPIMGDSDGNVTYQLLRAGMYLKDNRLLPAGANKARLPKDIAVYGEAADDKNFAGGGDTVRYEVDVKDAAGPFTVSAELLYEPLSYQFIQDLLADETPLTQRFGGIYAQADKSALVAAAIEPAQTK